MRPFSLVSSSQNQLEFISVVSQEIIHMWKTCSETSPPRLKSTIRSDSSLFPAGFASVVLDDVVIGYVDAADPKSSGGTSSSSQVVNELQCSWTLMKRSLCDLWSYQIIQVLM